MKTALITSAATVASAAITYSAPGTAHPMVADPVVVADQTTLCYKDWGSAFMGNKAYDPTCNATAGGVPVAGPQCIWTSTGTMSESSIGATFGAHAAADRACCEGLGAHLALGFEMASPIGWDVSLCQFQECGIGGANTTAQFWKYSPSDSANFHSAGQIPVRTHNKGVVPSQSLFLSSSQAVFKNGGACYLHAKAHIATTLLTNAAYPMSMKGALAGVFFPYMDKRMATDMNPRTPQVTLTNEPQFCFFNNGTAVDAMGTPTGNEQAPCDHPAATIKIKAPNCVHRGSVSNNLMFVYGEEVANLPGCCDAMQTMVFVFSETQGAWFYDGPSCDFRDANGVPSCMTNGASQREFWKLPGTGSGNLTNPERLYGRFPTEAAFENVRDVMVKDDAKCFNTIFSYVAANPKLSLNAMVSAYAPLIKMVLAEKFPTTTPAPTTVAATSATSAASETTAVATTAATTAAVTQVADQAEGTTAPTAAAPVTIQSSFTATEDLPASITATQLLASTAYKSAKKTGIASALGVSASKVTITGFTLARRGLLSNKRSLAATSVQTSFEVEAANSASATTLTTSLAATTMAATIKTAVNTAFAATDFSNDSVISSVPSVTAVSAVAPATAKAATTPAASSGANFVSTVSSLLVLLVGCALF